MKISTCAVVLLLCNLRILAQDSGHADMFFGTFWGTNTVNFQNALNTAKLIFLQNDGKILVLGNSHPYINVQALRFDSDGNLDPLFGNGGIYNESTFGLPQGSIEFSELWSGALQSDGKVLLSGVLRVPMQYHLFVIRLNVNGTRDESFGNNGVFLTNLPFFSSPASKEVKIALSNDGDIFVFSAIKTQNKFSLLKINPNGTLDADFGNLGELIMPTSYSGTFNMYSTALAISPDDKIVAQGIATTPPNNIRGYIFRYFSDGTPDHSFDGNGELIINDYSAGGDLNMDRRSIAFLPDGKMLFSRLHGFTNSLIRLNNDGTIDTSFGVNGSAPVDIAFTGFISQLDGKIVCAGASDYIARLVRLNADGSLDTLFGDAGYNTPELFEVSRFTHVVQQSDGKVVACGHMGSDFLVARYYSQNVNTETTDTREPAFDPKVSVSPNPSQGVLTVEFELNEAQAVALVLYDLSGRQLRSLMAPTQLPEGVFSRIFHLTDVPSGTYLLQIRGQEGEKSCVISLH